MGAVTVACVYKPGNGFFDEYVYRLRDGVKRFCGVEHRFVCLTNARLFGVECIPLVNDWSGWWNKLELFRRGLFDGLVTYFDLDTLFRRSIDEIVSRHSRFASLTHWTKPDRRMASAVMTWDGRQDLSHIPAAFDPAISEQYERVSQRWGDQAFIQAHLGFQHESLNEVFPGRIVSYKLHVGRGPVPREASVVCFHGLPRPHQIGWRLP